MIRILALLLVVHLLWIALCLATAIVLAIEELTGRRWL